MFRRTNTRKTTKTARARVARTLGRADVRAGLADFHQRRAIRLARINLTAARASLTEPEHGAPLLDASEVRTPDRSATFHAVAMP
jgi:hypothetical protein